MLYENYGLFVDDSAVFPRKNVQEVQQSSERENSSEVQGPRSVRIFSQTHAAGSSKTQRSKAKSTIRLKAESGSFEPALIEQDTTGNIMGRCLEVYQSKKTEKDTSLLPLNEEQLLIDLYDDVEDRPIGRLSKNKDLIDLDSPNQEEKAQMEKVEKKPKYPDSSLMASKYASLPDKSVSAIEFFEETTEGKNEKRNKSMSSLEGFDFLTGSFEELKNVPVLMPQNKRNNDNSDSMKERSTFSPDTNWIISANKWVIPLYQPRIEICDFNYKGDGTKV